jgi:hypothetical protein
MQRPFRLITLALLTACGPKVAPTSPIEAPDASPSSELAEPSGEPIASTSEGTIEANSGPFRWTDAFGVLELSDDLAGRTVEHRTIRGWESRTTARPALHVPRHAPPTRGAFSDDAPAPLVEGGGGLGAMHSHTSGARSGRKSGPPMAAFAEARPVPSSALSADSGALAIAEPEAPTASMSTSRPRPGQSLKAGTTDDNQNFDGWLSYVSEWGSRADISGWADQLDVNGRRHLQVLDARGRPVPDAQVSVIDPTDERVVWAGRAYGDGRVPMYPHLEVPGRTLDIAGDAPEGGWLVQATAADGAIRTVRWDGRSAELDIILDSDGLKVGAAVPVDVCFIIDTTGSMGDEINRIKSTLLSVTDQLRGDASQGVDLRYGAVLYRDIGDEYVTRRHAFTGDLEGFDGALQTIAAGGGGDGPESLNQGLAVGIAGMDWREGAARVAFVIADAPPHMDYQEDVSYGRAAAAAAHRGIRVHTVAASGLNDRGSFAFRQIAQLTRGQFIYVEYGSAAASAADHGVAHPAGSNNLDDILYGRIRAEIDGWGKDGTEKVARR